MGDGFFGFGPLGCGGAGMSSGPIGAPGSSKQRGQNHSPSGMASSAGIKHPKWYGESHCMRGKREGLGTEEGRDKWEKKTDLITLQRRIVISIILGTNDAVLRGIEICRMSRQIGELVVWPGEEESRVLTCSDPGYPVGRDVSIQHQQNSCNYIAGNSSTQRRYRGRQSQIVQNTGGQTRKRLS